MNIPYAPQKQIPAGMIDLAIGQPSPWLLPLAEIESACADFGRRGKSDLLAYGFEQGDPGFRNALAGWLEPIYREPVAAEQLLVTNGASQALDLVCTLFARPGDTILVEEPTYFLARKIFADHQLKPVALPMDAEGLITDALEEELQRSRPAFLYTIPAFHNPTSVTLSASRREKLAEVSRRCGLLVVADEVYHPLAYTAPPPPPMAGRCLSADIVSLGSFSKILAPGLRLGWLQASPARVARIVGCGLLDSGGGLNPFTSGVVGSAIGLGLLTAHLSRLRRTYAERLAAICAALRAELSGRIEFAAPEGGFFIWVRLPEGSDAQALLPLAKDRLVEFVPGPRFSSRGGLGDFIRLSFAFYDTPELITGVERLAAVIRSQ
jgi:DNA-binding transcriptional MocR family regulator